MTKNKPIEIIDRLYNVHIFGWYGSKIRFVTWAQQKFQLSSNDVNGILAMKAQGQMIPLVNDVTLVFVDEELKLDNPATVITVVHEAQHVAFRVLKSRGVIYSAKSEEAFTYYASWLAYELMKGFLGKETSGKRKSKTRS